MYVLLIDERALLELEQRLEEAERLVRQSDMEDRMQQLKDEKFAQVSERNGSKAYERFLCLPSFQSHI